MLLIKCEFNVAIIKFIVDMYYIIAYYATILLLKTTILNVTLTETKQLIGVYIFR